ncbi:hypothetical protein B9Z55_003189 [Caenorhabditis nigoni]|uniref:Domain of unknown function WSN domain-containing protein n=1 Tax=Caenorhabditis nigoni TaxID=1611254 RepID=A0A2G5VNY3_9PELO|nr:hypothetical protein B9Z55_003189 [Caenorhabditis nigoni]
MWLIKSLSFILLIGLTKSKKDSQFDLDEYYQEASEIYGKTHKINLEYELAYGKLGGFDVAERVLKKKIDPSVLEEYVEMKISGGLKEQNEILELFEKAKESETSDQLKKDVEKGFTLMEGFSDLKSHLLDFNTDYVERDIKKVEERLNPDYDLYDELSRVHLRLSYTYDYIAKEVKPGDPLGIHLAIQGISRMTEKANYTLNILEKHRFLNDLQALKSFKRAQAVTEKLKSVMNEVRNLEGLDSKLLKVVKEMETLEVLRDGIQVEEIKQRFQNLSVSLDFVKNSRISKNAYGEYVGINPISPLLDQIKAFSSKLKTFEFRTSRISKEWFPLQNHFEIMNIPSGNLTEKFSNFKQCIQNFDFHPTEIYAGFDEKWSQILSLDLEIQNEAKRMKEVQEIADNMYKTLTAKCPELPQMKDCVPLIQQFLNENTYWRNASNKHHNRLPHPRYPDEEFSTLVYNILQVQDLLKEMHLDDASKVIGQISNDSINAKQFLECCSNLETKASDSKELLVLPGKVWNFDPKVLEGTVEVIGMFKEAHKMVEGIKKWKIASNPEIENFPLDGEDVRAVSEGMNVLETIRNVQNGWEIMKTLDVENSGIKDSWNLLDSSLSQFFEFLSSQKTLNLSNVSFPTNLPIDTISAFIQDEYQKNQRNDIFNFLKEIQKLETDYPEYPNKLEKMDEVMRKMREWENEKMDPVKKMVDCFEIECDTSLKVPEASN